MDEPVRITGSNFTEIRATGHRGFLRDFLPGTSAIMIPKTADGISEPNLQPYGSDAAAIRAMGEADRLHPALDLTAAGVRWHVRVESPTCRP